MRTWIQCICRTISTATSMAVWCPHCHGAGGWWKDYEWNTIGTTGTSQQELDGLRAIAKQFNKHWGLYHG